MNIETVNIVNKIQDFNSGYLEVVEKLNNDIKSCISESFKVDRLYYAHTDGSNFFVVEIDEDSPCYSENPEPIANVVVLALDYSVVEKLPFKPDNDYSIVSIKTNCIYNEHIIECS